MSDATTTSVDPEVTTVMDIVDTLEELVGGGRRLPFTPSVVVNEEDILELVDRIRVALPDDLLSARHIVEERELVLERGQRDAEELTARAQHSAAELAARAADEAQRVVSEAQAHAATLVEQSTIMRTATEQARVLAAEAETQASAQRHAADDYARDAMVRLEEQLEKVLGSVRAGLQTLPGAAATTRRRKH